MARPCTAQISRGKTQVLPRTGAGFTKRTHPYGAARLLVEGLVVMCPLAPSASRLIPGFCSSPRGFVLGFLRTPPHGDAVALRQPFGPADTWDCWRRCKSAHKRRSESAQRPSGEHGLPTAATDHCLWGASVAAVDNPALPLAELEIRVASRATTPLPATQPDAAE